MVAFLRSHRRRAGLTLESLAQSTGLTKSYLSKVERGLSTPSIAVALKIARALNTDVSQLFSDSVDSTAMAIERSGERAEVSPEVSAGPAVYDAIATQMIRKTMQPFVVHPTTEPGSDFMQHPGEEFIFVQSGAVEVNIPNQVVILHKGDSLYFDSSTPHRGRSISERRAVLLVVVHDRDSGLTSDDSASIGQRRCGSTV